MTDPSQVPSPTLFFETISAFHRSAALKAALDLGVFTAIGSGNTTVPALASACQAAERGIRILCDNLVLMGFLTKTGETYGLTPDTALFLDQNSPAYLGGATEFMCAPLMVDIFRDLAATVRKGGTTLPDQGSVTPDNPIWVQFARAMAPM